VPAASCGVRRDLLRHLLPPVAAACVGGVVAAGGFIASNGALWDLIQHTREGWLAGVLLAMGFVSTFSAVAVGLAVQGGR